MIRYFCDCCGKEINERDAKDRNPLHRLTAKLKRGNSELQVEVIETKDGTSNAGNFCRYCVLDALMKLDDRPRYELERLQALAAECAKQAEPVPFNAPGKAHVEAMLGSASPPAVQTCSYPSCNCPFDAPADVNWCARGLRKAAPPAVQSEPVTLHIDPITPDDRKRYYDFEKYADHLPTCKQPRGDQSCECGYSAVRTNLSDLLDELSAPAQQEPKYVLASERAKQSATTNVGIDWANPATLNGSAPPAVQAEPVAWMVGNDPMTAATYNAGDKEKAFDAAKRWNWPITGLSVIAGAPDFDINYQQTKPVGEWRMKNGEPMHVIWRAKYKPQLGDKLYTAPPAVQSMEQRLRDALEAMGSKKAQTLTAGDLLQVVSDVDAPPAVQGETNNAKED